MATGDVWSLVEKQAKTPSEFLRRNIYDMRTRIVSCTDLKDDPIIIIPDRQRLAWLWVPQ